MSSINREFFLEQHSHNIWSHTPHLCFGVNICSPFCLAITDDHNESLVPTRGNSNSCCRYSWHGCFNRLLNGHRSKNGSLRANDMSNTTFNKQPVVQMPNVARSVPFTPCKLKTSVSIAQPMLVIPHREPRPCHENFTSLPSGHWLNVLSAFTTEWKDADIDSGQWVTHRYTSRCSPYDVPFTQMTAERTSVTSG